MADKRPLIVLAVFVVLIGAGLGWSQTRSKSSASVGSAVQITTTTSTAITSTTTPVSVASGDVDWNGVIKQIVGTENALFTKPDASKVNTYMVPTCSCYSDTVTRLQKLQSSNWHVAGNTETLSKAAFASGTTSSLELVVTLQSAGNPTVDAKGNVIEKPATGASLPMVYDLTKGTDGVWRIADRRPLAQEVPQS